MTFTPLQAMPLPPLPSSEVMALVILALLAGMSVPTQFGIERLQGFGRAVMGKLPYRPPPGMDAEEAMVEAVEEEESAVQTDDKP